MKTIEEINTISDNVFDDAINAFWDKVMVETLHLKGKDLNNTIACIKKELENLSFTSNKKGSINNEKNRLEYNM